MLEQVEQWRHVLKSHCQQAFKKIRINKKRHIKPLKPEIAVLVDKRNSLIMDHKVTENKIEVEEIEKAISRIEAEESRELVMKNFKRFSDDPENIDLQEVWKVLKNISPKFQSSTPTAKLNHKGKFISNSNVLKNSWPRSINRDYDLDHLDLILAT